MRNKKFTSFYHKWLLNPAMSCNKWFFYMCCLLFVSPIIVADDITFADVQPDGDTINVKWDVFGQTWFAVLDKDPYMGDDIPLIKVSLATGNEQFLNSLDNCYYRGALADQNFDPMPNTNAYVDLCNDDVPFTGFVSTQSNVYTITVNSDSVTGISMQADDPNQELVGGDSVKENGPQGPNNNKPPAAQLYPRNAGTELFPSLEILVEPDFVAKVGEDAYLARIRENLAFANFIYQQSGMKELNLIAITLLDENIRSTGGTGNIRHDLQNLRSRTAQPMSADMTLLYVGGDINTANTWGWAEDGYACDLQRAVTLGENIRTVNIGKSSGLVIDLPSLIQRGWILAHEIGHILDSGHIQSDPLMDGWFQYIAALPDYVAGCAVTTQMYRSCAYNNKNKRFNDFYECQ